MDSQGLPGDHGSTVNDQPLHIRSLWEIERFHIRVGCGRAGGKGIVGIAIAYRWRVRENNFLLFYWAM